MNVIHGNEKHFLLHQKNNIINDFENRRDGQKHIAQFIWKIQFSKKKLNITLLFIHRLQRYETEIVIVIVIESASEMIDPLME